MARIIRIRPRVAVVVNKRREAEGFLQGMKGSGFLSNLWVKEENTPPAPWYRMAAWRMDASLEQMDFVVLCIEDIMPPANSDVPESSGSHSQQKAMLLPGYLSFDDPDLVISVSTAESTPGIQPGKTTQNGSVVLGGGFFTYDAHQFDPTSPSRLTPPPFADNNVDEGIYQLLADEALRQAAVQRFQTPPNEPAAPMQILCDPSYIAVAAINVVHYQAYQQADPAAYNACVKQYGIKHPATIETTHGLVRSAAGRATPTLFVSPITDRYEQFNWDVDPEGRQNHAASYNAGVTTALLLRELDKSAPRLLRIH